VKAKEIQKAKERDLLMGLLMVMTRVKVKVMYLLLLKARRKD
jgi:hypothetical protein